jgi:pimeloyl-ACP methyl ester carboxylesterase
MTNQTSLLHRPDESTARARSSPSNGTDAFRAWLDDHRASVLALPLVVGAVLGLLLPRGPVTALTALATVGVTFLVGAAAGATWRSPWAYLTVPLLLAVGWELVRIPVTGPSVDLPTLSTMFGWLALVGGRGLLALVTAVPAALGIVVGRNRVSGLWTRSWTAAEFRVLAAVLVLGLLAAAVGRPASTAPITGPDGQVLPDSVAELTRVPINGRDLGIMVRGHDVANPVVLYLAGGPGGTELGAMRRHLSSLEEHATVVTWDQRGTGRSYGALDPVDTYTLASAVDDTIAMTEYLLDRFDKDELYLLGQSWGSTLGVLAAQERPDLYAAYVGTGQMVSQTATDRIGYQDTVSWARAEGHDELADALEEQGPPPYPDDVTLYEQALSHEPQVYDYDHTGLSEGSGGFSENLLVEEYSLVDLFHVFPGFLDTASVLYPQLTGVDFRDDVTELEVPVHFVQGGNETRARAELFEEWFPMLEAPSKDLVVFERSGHRPLFEQPGEFVDYMTEEVLPTQ